MRFRANKQAILAVLKEIREPLTGWRSIFWYNWTRIHKTLGVAPAMAAGITDRLLSMSDLAEMVDAALPKPGKRGPYKKQSP